MSFSFSYRDSGLLCLRKLWWSNKNVRGNRSSHFTCAENPGWGSVFPKDYVSILSGSNVTANPPILWSIPLTIEVDTVSRVNCSAILQPQGRPAVTKLQSFIYIQFHFSKTPSTFREIHFFLSTKTTCIQFKEYTKKKKNYKKRGYTVSD